MAEEAKEQKMTATIGKPPEFQADSGNFEIYLERFELFVAANDIAEEKKLQVFLTAIGEKAYTVLRSLLLPKTPNKVSYQEAVSILQKHYAPRRSLVTERFRFNRRNQGPHETVTDFAVELKKLAATCEFGAFLEEALRDRLIAGLHADTIRCRLLAMPDTELTWDRACSIATAMETAAQDTKEMLTSSNAGQSSNAADVNWQQAPAPPRRTATTNAPTKSRGHGKKATKAVDQRTKKPCHRCGEQHLPARPCHSGAPQPSHPPNYGQRPYHDTSRPQFS
ncbi:uncharacterized protein LOC120842585 [Ixodes scapularis]|uniref:uncharacterized protein LOC120842585 n=1 Tax=Ixodes scapularis TaxID=6945 RepID=UPI001A9FBC90|nr:uncharacterized protein LOC120842585 [Ixodes scapularis]